MGADVIGVSVNSWRGCVDHPLPAAAQMARDVELAQAGEPSLRFFEWDPPAVSLGFKQPRPSWLDSVRWRASGCEAVERPTGGGIAVHGSDLSMSIVVPRHSKVSLDALMRAACQSAQRVCEAFGMEAWCRLDVPAARRVIYCLTEASPYAVFLGARKVAGFALRRFARSWLIEGSLLLSALPPRLERGLPAEVMTQLRARAVALEEAAGRPISAQELAQTWAEEWQSGSSSAFWSGDVPPTVAWAGCPRFVVGETSPLEEAILEGERT